MEAMEKVILSQEEIDKRKGKRISITVHAILLLLAIIPFMAMKETVPPAITIVFTDFKSGGSTEGASGGQKAKAMATPDREEAAPRETYTKPTPTTPTPPTPTPVTQPTPQPQPEPVEEIQEVEEVEVVPTPQEEVLTDDSSNPPLPPVEETEDVPDEVVVEEPAYEIVPEETQEADVEETEEAEEAPESFFPESSKADGTGNSSSEASDETGDDSFFSDGDGEADTNPGSGLGDNEPGNGTGDSGNGTDGSGNSGSGGGTGDGEGDGVLGRKVIYRANITEVAQGKVGKIVIDLCINKNGIVTYAEIDKIRSTIKETDVQSRALDAILNYRFEKDPRAPSRECGKYTLKWSRHGFEFR